MRLPEFTYWHRRRQRKNPKPPFGGNVFVWSSSGEAKRPAFELYGELQEDDGFCLATRNRESLTNARPRLGLGAPEYRESIRPSELSSLQAKQSIAPTWRNGRKVPQERIRTLPSLSKSGNSCKSANGSRATIPHVKRWMSGRTVVQGRMGSGGPDA